MKVAVFSAKSYDRIYFASENRDRHTLEFLEPHLTSQTTALAAGFDAVCCFVNDDLNSDVIAGLKAVGVRLIVMRCAGFNNVDLEAAAHHSIKMARVPDYSPFAVAEHAVALMLDLNRHIHRAHNRIRENNYSLDGLLGFDLYGKTVGVIGTGKIGITFARIMAGFGCRVLASDPQEAAELEGIASYVDLESVFAESDVISLHCPLLPATRYLINAESLSLMKPGVMLINTSRGGLIDTTAVIAGLKSGQIGYLGLDVYEEEADLFFENNSDVVLQDDVFARLLTFPNVIITGHQAFFTREALRAIAIVTLDNLDAFLSGRVSGSAWVV